MTLSVHGAVPAEVVEQLAPAASARTLEDVVRYGLASSPPRRIEEVVTQDEYTHDVVIPFDDAHFLVFDAT